MFNNLPRLQRLLEGRQGHSDRYLSSLLAHAAVSFMQRTCPARNCVTRTDDEDALRMLPTGNARLGALHGQ